MKKQLKHIALLTLFLVFFSCGTNSESIPEIISKDKMIDLLTELELTQALVKLKLATGDTINHQELFNEVYAEFNTSQNQFNNSLNYYCKDPKLLMSMYAKVIETLTQKQSEQ